MKWIKIIGVVVSLILFLELGGLWGFWMWIGGIFFWLHLMDTDAAREGKL